MRTLSLAVLVLLISVKSFGQAQTNVPAVKPRDRPPIGQMSIPEMIAPAPHPSTPSVPDNIDPETKMRYEELLRANYEYQTYSYAHAKRIFDWQDWSGRVIFWMVMALVGAGLVFSSIHFIVGLTRPVATSDKKPESPGDATEFEATLQGIKLKSSVLGLAILTMSMVFFYMYLKFVYPITNISQ